MDIQMNNIFSAIRSIGVASTVAFSFDACASTATVYDSPDYHFQTQPENHIPASEPFQLANSPNLSKFITSAILTSGPNSLQAELYTNDQFDKAAKEFIFKLKDHQVDIDLETKALISENLWDLYD